MKERLSLQEGHLTLSSCWEEHGRPKTASCFVAFISFNTSFIAAVFVLNRVCSDSKQLAPPNLHPYLGHQQTHAHMPLAVLLPQALTLLALPGQAALLQSLTSLPVLPQAPATSTSPRRRMMEHEDFTSLAGYWNSSDSYQFSPASVIVPVVFSLIFLLGTVGNSLVLAVLLRNGQVKYNTTNLFILNLSLADFFFIVFCVPFQATIYSLDGWVFGSFLCKAVHFFIYLTMYASSFTLATVSVDRYLAIRYPLRSRELRTPYNAVAAMAVIWGLSVVFAGPYLSYYDLIEWESSYICMPGWEEWRRKVMDTSTFAFGYVIPVLVISLSYTRTIKYLWTAVEPLEDMSESKKAKRKLTWSSRMNAPAPLLTPILLSPLLSSPTTMDMFVIKWSLLSSCCLFWTKCFLWSGKGDSFARPLLFGCPMGRQAASRQGELGSSAMVCPICTAETLQRGCGKLSHHGAADVCLQGMLSAKHAVLELQGGKLSSPFLGLIRCSWMPSCRYLITGDGENLFG
uniref:Galanin receptor type 2-like n=1 Tax=Coturnix japonica TaxID=93934 RepID=A0A8C2U707_COTJA